MTTPPPPRICSTCGAEMKPAGKRSWICPNQKDQGNGISPAMQARVRIWLRERVAGIPF